MHKHLIQGGVETLLKDDFQSVLPTLDSLLLCIFFVSFHVKLPITIIYFGCKAVKLYALFCPIKGDNFTNVKINEALLEKEFERHQR